MYAPRTTRPAKNQRRKASGWMRRRMSWPANIPANAGTSANAEVAATEAGNCPVAAVLAVAAGVLSILWFSRIV